MVITTVSVIGASGGIGSHVVKHALMKGHRVKALVRSREKFLTKMRALDIGADRIESVHLVVGSASDTKALREAVDRSDHVISCLGNVRGAKELIVEKATRKLVGCMESAGVNKLQIVSSIGIGDSWEQVTKLSFVFSRIIMPFVIAPTVKDLNAAEDFLLQDVPNSTAAAVEPVIVRPPGLGDLPGTGSYDAVFATHEPGTFDGPGKYGGGGPLLPRSDVALAMVDMVDNPGLFKKHVGKPVSLLPVSSGARSEGCSVQ